MSKVLTHAQSEAVARCLNCGPQRLARFRPLWDVPPIRLSDFCVSCEDKHGVDALYEKFAGRTDPTAAEHIKKTSPQRRQAEERKVEREKAAAQRDLAERILASRHIIAFIKRFMPSYDAGWVHHDIASRLERFVAAVEAGESPRLILAIPPRGGKSILGSDFLPSWILGKHPEWEVIAASHSVSLSMKFSRAIRDRLKDPKYHAVFPHTKLREDAGGAEDWMTTAGGGYRAAGVGTGILGRGAHVLIIDDPFPDAESAYSENNREKVLDWFNTTAMTRLSPGGGCLIIAQRWHDEDLTGKVLALKRQLLSEGASPEEIDNWELVNYPAIAEGDEYLMPSGEIVLDPLVTSNARLLRRKGEALHPARYDLPRLLRIKSRMPPNQWNALYQQNPVPDDGDFFSKDMFRFEPRLEGSRDDYIFLTAWDVAIGEQRRNDWSVGVVIAVDWDHNIHVVDMVRGRFGTYELVTQACDLIEKWDCTLFGMEHGQIKMTLWPLIVDEMRRRKITCSISDELKPVTDKEVRAQPLQGMMQTGRVFFPLRATHPWVETMEAEMLRFPLGAHDDIVDALAWATRLFQKAPRPRRVEAELHRGERPWRERLEEFGVSVGGRSGTSFMAN